MRHWDPATAAHLYRRAGFGADRNTRESARSLDDALQDIFSRRKHDALLMRGVDKLVSLEEIGELQAWWMALILRDRAPLVERVALMWHDHFATSNDKVRDVRLMHAQVQLFREKGLGDFRELLHAVATDPAMLIWLDGNDNRDGHPNENFAREVLELFALGIGNYQERDILEGARAFSGWGVDGRRFVFRRQYHDEGIKEFLGARGPFTGEEVIDRILAHPACARHIAHKLLEEFVRPNPSSEEVDTWASVLLEEQWSIERTLERLFRSELFLGPSARRSRIAGPVELVAHTLITLGIADTLSPADVARSAAQMGQALYRPPSVKGWDGNRTWIHAGSWLVRHNDLTRVAMAPGEREDLAAAFGTQGRNDLAERALDLLIPDGAGPALRETVRRAAAESEDAPEARRTVTALILTAPEYHLI